MKTHPIFVIAALASLLAVTNCSKEEKADDLPSKSTIHSIIPEGIGIHYILLGSQVVHSGSNDLENKKISMEEFKEVEAWNQVGLIGLQSEDLPGASSSFTGFAGTKLPGAQLKRINVELTDKGRQMDAKTQVPNRTNGLAYGLFVSLKVNEIVSRELHTKAGSNYCVVHAIVRDELTDIGEQVYRARRRIFFR